MGRLSRTRARQRPVADGQKGGLGGALASHSLAGVSHDARRASVTKNSKLKTQHSVIAPVHRWPPAPAVVDL